MNKKQRVYSLDLLRCIAFFLILLYHFCVHLEMNQSFDFTNTPIFIRNLNMHIAKLGVGVFFILSGFGLMLSSEKQFKLIDYYKGRVTKILLPFWITYAVYFVLKFIDLGHWPFPGVQKRYLIFTLFGMDEWTHMMGYPNTSFGIGEWFLGTLMIIYLVFPLLRWLLKKNRWIFMAVVAAIYCYITFFYHYEVVVHMNLFLKACEFCIGMILALYYDRIPRFVGIICLAILLIFLFVPVELPLHESLKITILCTAVFTMFITINGFFAEHLKLSKVFQVISAFSYEVFLVHHVIIIYMANRYIGVSMSAGLVWLLALMDLGLILVTAIPLHYISGFGGKLIDRICTKKM